MSTERLSWDKRELPDFFQRWREKWQDPGLLPHNYLDYEGGLPGVLAAAWLFCPETVEYRGGISSSIDLGNPMSMTGSSSWPAWGGVAAARDGDRRMLAGVSDEEDGAYGPTITFWTADRVSRVDRSPRWLLPAVLAALVLAVIVGAVINL